MLKELQRRGELDNTLIIVTSDNGMAFPRAKANMYEYGFHMPLAIRWGSQVKPGRTVDDLIVFADLTATIVEAAGADPPTGELGFSGRSIMSILESDKDGIVDPSREFIVAGRERHSSSRFNSLSYPQRAIRSHDFLYIRNFKPERWPAGPGQKYKLPYKQSPLDTPEAVTLAPAVAPNNAALGGEHDGYHDIDACPTLSYLVQNRDDPKIRPFFEMAVAKRPLEELFDIKQDPGCINNLANDPKFKEVKDDLWGKLSRTLTETGDPRMKGDDVFESYRRYSPIRYFPIPDWAETGDVPTPNWALPPTE